jgi:asparagine synthase (glutamine-hydrolysing)
VNLQRDDASTAASGVHLETPFLDLALVRAALSFPVSLNVRGSDDRLRKHVLRKLAERLQLPREIVDMPKKAAQYGSGMDRALRRIAKDEGFSSIAEYLNGVFHEVFDLNSERDPL